MIKDDKEPEELPIEQYINDFCYTQLYRVGKVALYERTYNGNTLAIDVFLIKVVHKRDRFAELILGPQRATARECFPKLKDFGKSAWTFTTLESAKAKFQMLVQQQSVHEKK